MKSDLIMYDTVCYGSFYKDPGAFATATAYFAVETMSYVVNTF